nr:D-alanyl-lipoteichoic acid biosynthesis protein DltD [Clostridium botulinum]
MMILNIFLIHVKVGVKSLFASVPVHGKLYDYCGFSKEDRNEYYKKINKMVISYGFQILDLSQYEYGEYYAFSMGRMVAF